MAKILEKILFKLLQNKHIRRVIQTLLVVSLLITLFTPLILGATALSAASRLLASALEYFSENGGKYKTLDEVSSAEALLELFESGYRMSSSDEMAMRIHQDDFVYLLQRVKDYNDADLRTRTITVEGREKVFDFDDGWHWEYYDEEIEVSNAYYEGRAHYDYKLLYFLCVLAAADRKTSSGTLSSVICVDKDYKPIPYSTAGNAGNEEAGVTDEEPAETSPEEETTSVDDNVVVSEALPEGESEESYDDDEDSEPDADIPEEEEEEDEYDEEHGTGTGAGYSPNAYEYFITREDIDRVFSYTAVKFDYYFDVLRDSKDHYDFDECLRLPHEKHGLVFNEIYYPKSYLKSGEGGFSKVTNTISGSRLTETEEIFSFDRLQEVCRSLNRVLSWEQSKKVIDNLYGGRLMLELFEKLGNDATIAKTTGLKIDLSGFGLNGSGYSSYMGGIGGVNLDGLSISLNETQQQNVREICAALRQHGFTEAMIAGACGNLMQECDFKTTIDGGSVGLLQWQQGRKDKLLALAAEKYGGDWTDIKCQVEYMLWELDHAGYLSSMNAYIARWSPGDDATTIADVEIATDAWCAAVEGCTCHTTSAMTSLYSSHVKYHTSACQPTRDGRFYQHLDTRRKYALKFYEGVIFTSFGNAAGNALKLIELARSKIGCPYVHPSSGKTDSGRAMSRTGPDSFDCTGFLYWLLRTGFGFGDNWTTLNWVNQGPSSGYEVVIPDAGWTNVLPGDIMVRRDSASDDNAFGHLAIITDPGDGANGKIIHASSSAGGVAETGFSVASWTKHRYFYIFRIFPAEPDPAEGALASGDLSTYSVPWNASCNKVVYMKQGDFSDVEFGSGSVASCGCGIVSTAMALSYCLGGEDRSRWISPQDLLNMITAKTGDREAFYVYGDGCKHEIAAGCADYYGLKHSAVLDPQSLSEAEVIERLRSGQVAVASAGNGLFTKRGHFITITGCDDDGYIYLNDPSGDFDGYTTKKFTWPWLIKTTGAKESRGNLSSITFISPADAASSENAAPAA